ncbi:hypothetical protein K9M41_02185 [Candidatus Gracilibacteria bacterium]|nr:hypothetical protein [Candidatus Gracilibacteria bacterium]
MAENELKIPFEMVNGCPNPSEVTNIPVNETDTQIEAFCGICDSIPASVDAVCGSPEDGKKCVLNGKKLKGKPIATQWTD